MEGSSARYRGVEVALLEARAFTSGLDGRSLRLSFDLGLRSAGHDGTKGGRLRLSYWGASRAPLWQELNAHGS